MISIVTGGRGFVGHNLIGHLLKLGHTVYSIDNELAPPVGEKHVNVIYFKGCCSKINTTRVKADYVFHLGEYSRVEQSFKNPIECLKNITSTLPYILDYCAKNNSKLIYSGSSTKFGDQHSPYSIAKSSNANLINWYCREFNINYAITYFYNVYGDGERAKGEFSTVVSKFLHLKSLNKKAIINGTGNQKRNFTHVNDICEGILLVAKNGLGDSYGIGSSNEISIIQLAEMIGLKYSIKGVVKGNRNHAELITKKTIDLGWHEKENIKDYISLKLA